MKIIIGLLKLIVLVIVLLFAANYFLSDKVNDYTYPIRYKEYVDKYSRQYNVDRALIYAIIKNESDFNPYAESKAQAKGLMQIMDTSYEFAKKSIVLNNDDIFDKKTNIQIGTWLLSHLTQRFGDIRYAVMAYNAGPENVASWINSGYLPQDANYSTWNIPFGETAIYLDKVMKTKEIYHKKLQHN